MSLYGTANNSQILDEMMKHYSQEKDSLKRKAAKYLVNNMVYHQSFIAFDIVCWNLILLKKEDVLKTIDAPQIHLGIWLKHSRWQDQKQFRLL